MNQVSIQTKHSLRKEISGQTKQNPKQKKRKTSRQLLFIFLPPTKLGEKKRAIKYFARLGHQFFFSCGQCLNFISLTWQYETLSVHHKDRVFFFLGKLIMNEKGVRRRWWEWLLYLDVTIVILLLRLVLQEESIEL